jgi:3-oxo-5-alpha-steroid 4-dehydrogenase 1
MSPYVILSAIFFNLINPYVNAQCIFTLCKPAPFSLVRFLLGLLLFFTGMNINQNSDNILLGLKKQCKQEKSQNNGKTKYKIPTGGLYDYVSSANYFGEMVEWLGFYLITWNIGSLSFIIWTFCNLFPRGYANHLWYLKTFPDYPKNRKAIIPFVF